MSNQCRKIDTERATVQLELGVALFKIARLVLIAAPPPLLSPWPLLPFLLALVSLFLIGGHGASCGGCG